MVIYLILEILILILVFFTTGQYKKYLYYTIIALFCFIGLFRADTVGADVKLYCLNIQHTNFIPSSWNYYTNFESGYNILIAIYKYLCDNSLIFVGLCNVFFVLSWSYYNKAKNWKYDAGLMAFFMMGFYFQSFNIIRQYFALGIMLIILSHFNLRNLSRKDEILIACSSTAIGFLFHNSIFIFILVPLYNHIKESILNKKIFYYLILMVSAIFFYLGNVKKVLEEYTSHMFFINEKTTMYYQHSLQGITEEGDYSFFRILLDTFFLIYLTYRTKRIDIYLLMYVCGQVFINIFAPINTLYARVPVVFYIAASPLIVHLWRRKFTMDKAVVLLYLTIIFINVLIKNYGRFQPYIFSFSK